MKAEEQLEEFLKAAFETPPENKTRVIEVTVKGLAGLMKISEEKAKEYIKEHGKEGSYPGWYIITVTLKD